MGLRLVIVAMIFGHLNDLQYRITYSNKRNYRLKRNNRNVSRFYIRLQQKRAGPLRNIHNVSSVLAGLTRLELVSKRSGGHLEVSESIGLIDSRCSMDASKPALALFPGIIREFVETYLLSVVGYELLRTNYFWLRSILNQRLDKVVKMGWFFQNGKPNTVILGIDILLTPNAHGC